MNRPRSLWYALLAAFLSSVVGSVAAIQYADHTNRVSERKWCALIVELDDAYRSQTPRTELGRSIAEAIRMLRRDFGC